MSKREEAAILYAELQQAYGSSYFPSESEKSEAMFVLTNKLPIGYKKEDMINKIKVFSTMHGSHKSKVSTLIINEYWKQEIEFGVKPKKYIDEK